MKAKPPFWVTLLWGSAQSSGAFIRRNDTTKCIAGRYQLRGEFYMPGPVPVVTLPELEME